MKVKDLQFIKTFLLVDAGINIEYTHQLLDIDLQVLFNGEPDNVIFREKKIIYSNPSSIFIFLSKILYLITQKISTDKFKDQLAIAVLEISREYVYSDYSEQSILPVVISIDKIHVVSNIMTDIIEPLIGKLRRPKVLFNKCKITDAASIIRNSRELQIKYNFNKIPLSRQDFPLLMVNSAIHNKAAILADLLYCWLSIGHGNKHASKIIRNIVLNKNILSHVITIVKTIEGDPSFLMEFLKYLNCHAMLDSKEQRSSQEEFLSLVAKDDFLNKHIKIADGKYTPLVQKQWSQWSMLMGLIEKQLGPMRGSMWPTSENMKPHDEKLKAMMAQRARQKNKKHLNFEEMLETARNIYNHKNNGSSNLIETLLKDNRVWKS